MLANLLHIFLDFSDLFSSSFIHFIADIYHYILLLIGTERFTCLSIRLLSLYLVFSCVSRRYNFPPQVLKHLATIDHLRDSLPRHPSLTSLNNRGFTSITSLSISFHHRFTRYSPLVLDLSFTKVRGGFT